VITENLLNELRFKGEGPDLDYKSARYAFINASDVEKSELLKDILALANAHRDGTAYILIGFRENPPNPAEVVGLSDDGVMDDSRLQEFVNSKLETKLIFRYEERLFDGKHIALISIPKQPRPFYLTKDYGKLKKDIVYIRRGSSTSVASPREIVLMGTSQKGTPELKVVFESPKNEPLPNQLQKEFFRFPTDLPDYKVVSNLYFTHRIPNPDFWREAANYYSTQTESIYVRLSVVNNSSFSLEETQLEVTCKDFEGKSVHLCRADDLPDTPSMYLQPHAASLKGFIRDAARKLVINERGKTPVAIASLGTILAHQTRHAEEDLVILPRGPGKYSIQVLVYSHELPMPTSVEHQLEISGPELQISKKDLEGLISQEDW